ncbi:MAG: polymerase sigma-B factor [Actinomycetota bacterium]|jgi:RNA polymerase sigma-B factor|nr:polymerase sigma-B factor [Actinomycetota bacterium]
MTSLADLPTSLTPDGASAESSRQERHALTDSILLRIAHCRNARERSRLQQEAVLVNLGLADGIAARYAGRGVEWDDLVQVARLGLLKAVVGYQPDKGAGFEAYATPTIAGEIKRYFRDYGWMVRPPRRLQELHSELRSVEPELRQRLQGAPSANELARALCVEPKELSEALTAAGGYCALSLDVPTHADSGLSLGDALPDDCDPYRVVERAEWLRPALARLTKRERRIVSLRFVDDLSQEQIGRQLGISQMQVSRLLAGILGRLREELEITDSSATA